MNPHYQSSIAHQQPGQRVVQTRMVVVIDPAARACRLTHIHTSAEEIIRLTGTRTLHQCEIARHPSGRSIMVGCNIAEPSAGPRYRIGPSKIAHGIGILFAVQDERWTSVPVDGVWAMERIQWLDAIR